MVDAIQLLYTIDHCTAFINHIALFIVSGRNSKYPNFDIYL